MMDIKKLIEDLDNILEDNLEDDFEDIEVTEDNLVEAPGEVETEKIDVTKDLENKTKISRALDVLISALDDFKNATAAEVDLLNDTVITTNIENLTDIVNAIQDYVAGQPNNLETQIIDDVKEIDIEDKEEDVNSDEDGEHDFEQEASLDLFNDEQNN